MPANALVVDEKSWITFPYTKTILTIPFFSKLKYEILSLHLDDDGSTHNALGLSPTELEMRKVDYLDIGTEKVSLSLPGWERCGDRWHFLVGPGGKA